MALSVDQFGKALVSACLFTADELKAMWNAIPADARPKQGDGFAKLLLQQGKLNQFQADELLSGRNTPLVMGDYLLVAELGAGGMGKVYKARHRRMERIVALKVMSTAAMQDEAAVKRFQREVKAAARLEHPNIVTAYDSGESGKVKYLVMQFVDGGDLSQLVKQSGPLEIERAVDYVLQAARGLAFAHGEGVVHRDIKPANLLLDKKGVVKILDMGLARIEGGDGLTATEQVMGTVDYMSPEQAANTKTADGRSDIYSLGCTLWFLLTAKKVYDGDTMISRLMSHRNDPPPSLVKARDDVPWSLEQAFHKMIAKSPEERFQSMDEVVAALEPFAPSGGSRSGVGSSIGMGPQSAEMASFLKSIGPAVKPQTKPAPSGTKVDVEATAQFAAAGADTDPKSQLLPPSKKAAQPQAKGSGKKPPPNKNLLLAAAGGGALLVLLGVWFIFRDKDGNEVARVQMPAGGSVTVQQPVATGGPTPVAAPTRPAVSFFLPNSTPASPSGTTTPPSVAPPPAVPSSNGVVYLDDLQEKSYFGLGALEKAGRNPSDVATLSKYFPEASPVHALVVHPETSGFDKHRYAVTSIPRHNYMSRLVYDLDGKYAAFRSGFRVRTFGKDSPHLAEVWGDGKLLWESGDLVPLGVAGATADVDVRGFRELTLIVWGDAGKRAALLTEPRLTLVAPVPSGGSPGADATGVVYLDDLQETKFSSFVRMQGKHGVDNAGKPLQWHGRQPAHSLSMHAHGDGRAASIEYLLAGKFQTLTATVGLNNHMVAKSPLTFRVLGDGRELWKSPPIHTETREAFCSVSVAGVQELRLEAVCDGSNYNAYAVWIEPRLTPVAAVSATTTPLPGTTVAAPAGTAPPPAVFPFDAATALKHQAAWAAYLGEPVVTTNSVGMKLVVIPPGEFLMGEKESQEGQVPVTLTKPFRLGIHEVTREQWRVVMGKDPGIYAADRGENCAANRMSQEEAVEFCQKLTERERTAGRLAPDAAYRLPTEAEWELACRAGTITAYSFGDDEALLGEYAWFKDSTGGNHYSWPVGRLKPNPWGLYDMYGNVQEWCHDWAQAQLSSGVDPQGPSEGIRRMRRGGDFASTAAECRTGFRNPGWNHTTGRDTIIGLRVALSRTGSGAETQAATSTSVSAPSPAVPSLSTATSTTTAPPSGSAPPPAVSPFDAQAALKHQEAWAKHLGVPVEFTNGVGMKFRLIPPGEFLMGSTDDQVEAALKVADEIQADQGTKDLIQNNERPQHKVVVTKPLLMSATEVTVGQFKKFAAATGYQTEAEKASPNDPTAKTYLSGGSDDLPAAFISWNDATAYCQWLSTQEKTTYRLPTEAEWEYACRGGTTTQYSFGDDHDELPKYGWYLGNAGRKSPHPVGMKLPNPFGLFDMHGNLYEWCGDNFDEKWYSASTPNDPIGPSAGSNRVIRGGNWNYKASRCRSASRDNFAPSARSNNSGFRCVRELPAPTTSATVTPQPAVPAASSGKLFMHDPAFPQWMKDVQAMPAEQQIEAVSKKLVELNPGFDGRLMGQKEIGTPKVENGVVTELNFSTENATDISPVRALVGLKSLWCGVSSGKKARLSDLSPLGGMGLTFLNCNDSRVTDLSPLKGMPLSTLYCTGTAVTDLSPLQGMQKLTLLACHGSPVSDLSPLQELPLKKLHVSSTRVTDVSPLASCKTLTELHVRGTKVTPASVAALQKALPNCKIEWDDPAKATLQPATGTK